VVIRAHDWGGRWEYKHRIPRTAPDSEHPPKDSQLKGGLLEEVEHDVLGPKLVPGKVDLGGDVGRVPHVVCTWAMCV
jgi:hypothetical protein